MTSKPRVVLRFLERDVDLEEASVEQLRDMVMSEHKRANDAETKAAWFQKEAKQPWNDAPPRRVLVTWALILAGVGVGLSLLSFTSTISACH